MDPNVNVNDKDLQTTLFFMISTATVLEEMIRDICRHPTMGVNFYAYQQKIRRYKPTYDGMMEDFVDSVFGEYLNKVSKKTFIENLAYQGWKYFHLANLNALFSLMHEKYGTTTAL